jgi:hypothetical protein
LTVAESFRPSVPKGRPVVSKIRAFPSPGKASTTGQGRGPGRAVYVRFIGMEAVG